VAIFLLRRLGHSALVILAVTTLTFFLIRLAPGDPVRARFGEERVSPEVVERYKQMWGLDRSLPVQYGRYLKNLAGLNFGHSFSLQRPVSTVIATALPNTLLLATAALFLSFTIGIGFGTFQGISRGSKADTIGSLASLTIFSTPIFWLGIMLLLVFGQELGWFPIGSAVSPVHRSLPWIQKIADRIHHLVLPATALGLSGAAVVMRFHRAEVTEVMERTFLRTAIAKGIAPRRVVFVHILRNSLVGAITIFGLSLPVMFSGAVLVEQVFSWPGMGQAAYQAVLRRDYDVVTAMTILGAAMVTLGNLLADLLHQWADPRTRST